MRDVKVDNVATSSSDANDGNVATQKAKKATRRATECHGGGASFKGASCGGSSCGGVSVNGGMSTASSLITFAVVMMMLEEIVVVSSFSFGTKKIQRGIELNSTVPQYV
jgi:hypothetical protein